MPTRFPLSIASCAALCAAVTCTSTPEPEADDTGPFVDVMDSATDDTTEPPEDGDGDDDGDSDFALPTRSEDFAAWMEGLGDALTTDNVVVLPSEAERTTFRAALDALLSGDLETAAQQADAVDYALIALTDAGADDALVYSLEPADANTDHRGWFAIRPDGHVARDLILEAPHARFDTNSGAVASMLFSRLGARAFAMNGTHRCANTTASGCDGTTSVCGASEPYRESDMAHIERSFFQVFHEVLAADTDLVTIQVHGMAADDPAFSVSNGRTTDTTDTLSNDFADELETRMASAGSALDGNSCNRSGDTNLLCGTTNTQGRFSNGVASEDVCTESASSPTDRFIHLELSGDLRSDSGDLSPGLVAETLEALYPASSPTP